jgi:3-hydroxyacyl-[acyl-carrier-protein] dehydratase
MLNQEQIKEIIPHRAPFLLLDEITELEPGVRAVGKWHLTGDEEFFKGHFPGNPVLPGVLIVESLAQTGAVAVLSMEQFKGKIGYFAGIDGVKFKRKVLPGDTLTLEVELIKIRGIIGIGKAVATVNGEKAAYGELTFAIN